MLYRAELLSEGEIIAAQSYPDTHPRTKVTHPQQAMRRVVEVAQRHGHKPTYMAVYVINEEGTVWTYTLKRREDGLYEAKTYAKQQRTLSDQQRRLVLSGGATVHEVMGL